MVFTELVMTGRDLVFDFGAAISVNWKHECCSAECKCQAPSRGQRFWRRQPYTDVIKSPAEASDCWAIKMGCFQLGFDTWAEAFLRSWVNLEFDMFSEGTFLRLLECQETEAKSPILV